MDKEIENIKTLKRSKKRKNKINYCCKTKNNYCQICCKYFSSKGSHIFHMNAFHVEASSFKLPSPVNPLFKSELKPTNKKYWTTPTDIFIEYFENKMTSDFKIGNDKFRCVSCHHNFANQTEFLKHEIIHYRDSSVNNNDHVTQESKQKNFVVSLMTVNFCGISCISCKQMFTSNSDFDQHKNEDCKCDKHSNQENLLIPEINIKKEDKENNINDDDELLYESQVKLKIVPQKFNCIICKQMCECKDHLDIHNWWSESKTSVELKFFECFFCDEQFTEENEYNIHEKVHIAQVI